MFLGKKRYSLRQERKLARETQDEIELVTRSRAANINIDENDLVDKNPSFSRRDWAPNQVFQTGKDGIYAPRTLHNGVK